MRLAAALLCLSALTAAALEHVELFGRDYVRVQDWAVEHNFQTRWIEREKTVSLTSPTSRADLTVNSVQAQINGLTVWLSRPVALQKGVPFVSLLDWQSTIEPLLFPPRLAHGAKVRVVVLDPGHGGKDTGNIVTLHNEKKYTLALALEVRDLLKKSGIKVALTRSTDTFIELPDRPAVAKRLGADLFVSLHFNASEEDKNNVQGVETYCLTPPGASSTNARGEGADSPWAAGNRNNDKNLLLAWQLQHALVHNLDTDDRGVRRARFAILRDAVVPAALVEGGYMTHPVEGKKIFSDAYRHQMARAIANGIISYKRIVEAATK